MILEGKDSISPRRKIVVFIWYGMTKAFNPLKHSFQTPVYSTKQQQ
jgi:hypothetical protein